MDNRLYLTCADCGNNLICGQQTFTERNMRRYMFGAEGRGDRCLGFGRKSVHWPRLQNLTGISTGNGEFVGQCTLRIMCEEVLHYTWKPKTPSCRHSLPCVYMTGVILCVIHLLRTTHLGQAHHPELLRIRCNSDLSASVSQGQPWPRSSLDSVLWNWNKNQQVIEKKHLR